MTKAKGHSKPDRVLGTGAKGDPDNPALSERDAAAQQEQANDELHELAEQQDIEVAPATTDDTDDTKES